MSQAVFLVVTVAAVGLFYLATGKNNRALVFYLAWLILLGLVSGSGALMDTQSVPPRILMVLGPSLMAMVWIWRTLPANVVSIQYLLGIHALRLPVELVLHQLYLQGKIPQLMTYGGWNFDIVIGLSAIALLLYNYFGKAHIGTVFFKIWNLIGMVFLLWIVTLAVLSAPLPTQQLAFEQPNVAILEFPYTFLPTVVVPIVFLAHLHALLARRIR